MEENSLKLVVEPTPLKLVYLSSDSAKDRELRKELQKFLVNYRKGNQISEWHSESIPAGANREAQFTEQLEQADIIVLLISADFLSSNFVYELCENAMDRSRKGKTRVVPVLLRACDYKARFGELEILPAGAKPVNEVSSRDRVFTEIAHAIGVVIGEVRASKESVVRLPPKKPTLPQELLYLCNRSPQQGQMEIAVNKADDLSKRPFVTVIQGMKDECLLEYKERLRKSSFLKFPGSSIEPEDYPVMLPDSDESFATLFQRNLVENFMERTASLDHLANDISKKQNRVFVFSRLSTDRWKQQGQQRLVEAYLRFWNNFPNLAEGHRLICCLLLTHNINSYGSRVNANRARTFFRKHKLSLETGVYRDANGNIFNNLHAAVLKELEGPEEQDVLNWIEARHFKKLCATHDPRFCQRDRTVQEEIETLYKEPPRDRIPMRELAPKLEEIVTLRICQGN